MRTPNQTNLVEPGGVGGRLVKVHPRVSSQPPAVLRIVGNEVVQDHVEFRNRVPGQNPVHQVQELPASLAAVMPRMDGPHVDLHANARMPIHQLKDLARYGNLVRPNWIDQTNPNTLAPICASPDNIVVIVAGGGGRHSAWISGWVTRVSTEEILRVP